MWLRLFAGGSFAAPVSLQEHKPEVLPRSCRLYANNDDDGNDDGDDAAAMTREMPMAMMTIMRMMNMMTNMMMQTEMPQTMQMIIRHGDEEDWDHLCDND